MAYPVADPKTDPAIGYSCIDGEQIYRIDYDRQRGVLVAQCWGFWAMTDAQRYIELATGFVEAAHRSHGRALVLVDRRECPVQPAEIVEHIRKTAAGVLWPEDRFALIVKSALVAMQVKRTSSAARRETFTSVEEGEAWLFRNADD
jgi:hypothetical protein